MWVFYIPWEIYYEDKSINNAFRLAYAQISSENVLEASKRFSDFVYSITTK